MAGPKAKRSKTGCLSCRKRKVKCDETRPRCNKCVTQRFSCEWPAALLDGLRPTTGDLPTGTSTDSDVGPRRLHPAPACQDGRVGPAGTGDAASGAHAERDATWPQAAASSAILQAAPILPRRMMPCANTAVVLTPQERQLLDDFASTTLYSSYSFGEFDVLQYIIRELAPTSSVMTRMILAISATEMHRKEGLGGDGPDARTPPDLDPGLKHYSLALRHLRGWLAGSPQENSSNSIAVVMASIFLMVSYELHFPTSPAQARMHIAGLGALISSHPLFQDQSATAAAAAAAAAAADSGTGVPQRTYMNGDPAYVVSCHILRWLLYADISATSAGTSGSLLRLLTGSKNPLFQPAQIFKMAQVSNSRLWGASYPTSKIVADFQTQRPIELGHQLLVSRFNIWELKTRGEIAGDESVTAASILSHLMELGEMYGDVLSVTAGIMSVTWTAGMETITRLGMFYWACILYHRRMLGSPGPLDAFHRSVVSKLSGALFARHQRDDHLQRQRRVVWALFMAAIETPDAIHRGWLLERLRNARHLDAESTWLWAVAQDVLAKQAAPGVPWVDLADHMRSQDLDSIRPRPGGMGVSDTLVNHKSSEVAAFQGHTLASSRSGGGQKRG